MPTLDESLHEVRRLTPAHVLAACIVELILTTCGALIGQMVAIWAKIPPSYRVYPVVLCALVFGLVTVLLYIRYSRTIPRFARVKSDFTIRKTEIFFEFETDARIRYIRRKRLKACRDGLTRYYDRYAWSGDGPVTVSSLKAEHTVRDMGHQNTWRVILVEFGNRTLMRGEEIDIETLWEIDDSSQSSVPYLGHSIREPTEKLEFRLRFPRSLGARDFVGSVYPVDGTVDALASFPLSLSSTGEVTWSPPRGHPRLFHYYDVKWTYVHRTPNPPAIVKPIDSELLGH